MAIPRSPETRPPTSPDTKMPGFLIFCLSALLLILIPLVYCLLPSYIPYLLAKSMYFISQNFY